MVLVCIIVIEKRFKQYGGKNMCSKEHSESIHGYICVESRNRRFAYSFKDNALTVYSNDSLPLEEKDKINIEFNSKLPYVIGTDFNSGKNIVFFVNKIPFCEEGPIFWTSTTEQVYYYFYFPYSWDNLGFDHIEFSFKELDVFFPLNKGLQREAIPEGRRFKIETVPYEETKEVLETSINEKTVKIELGIKQKIRGDASQPIELSAILGCYFEKTLDIDFLLNIYSIFKRLFCFLCHRRSVQMNSIKLFGTSDRGYTMEIGELYILFEKAIIEDKKIVQKTIKYPIIANRFSNLIQLVTDDKLYFEHIPIDYDSSHHITVASFILDAAAFEWNFEHCYGDIPISKYRQEVKADILTVLDDLPENKQYNSKKKGELKHYSNIVKNVDRNLSEKILYALKDFDNVLSVFIKNLYGMNNMIFDNKSYNKIANDLQYQRNAYAHGDIDKKLADNIISDTIILEWIDYCLVLKSVGYSDNEMFNIINVIFDRNYIEKPTEDNFEQSD